ncbi:LOW QUALITY PROTEIN: gamma-glutamyl hydrolase-like [Antedon mediterranea]|uniref:LOW QUALITY PROTEIN: gamma-glutamyl hydrolase-like n=1 Tax=Antedon mediterranea TaxID=105859 RepID=UPI003AF54792
MRIFIVVFCCFLTFACYAQDKNYRPIIGIVAETITNHTIISKYGSSYVAASYVKFAECAGARVVLVKNNEKQDYYVKLFNSLNGLILPGGDVNNLLQSPYGKTAKIFFDLSIEGMDKTGDYFPILGICLGFQLLTQLPIKKDIMRHGSDSENLAIPLKFTPDMDNGNLFNVHTTPYSVLEALTEHNTTFNNHVHSVSQKVCIDFPQNFTKVGLEKFYRVLSVNNDRQGIEFLSTIEAYDYPIYGTQWHPEKNLFEWNTSKDYNIPHSFRATAVAQYVADFLVNEARKSTHRFSSEEEASKYLVYNYQPVYTGDISSFEQIYFLDP